MCMMLPRLLSWRLEHALPEGHASSLEDDCIPLQHAGLEDAGGAGRHPDLGLELLPRKHMLGKTDLQTRSMVTDRHLWGFRMCLHGVSGKQARDNKLHKGFCLHRSYCMSAQVRCTTSACLLRAARSTQAEQAQ